MLILVGHCRLVHNKFVHWGAMLPCMPLALAVALLVQMGGFPGPKFYTSPVSQKPFACRPTTADSSVAGSIGEVAPHVYASNACTHGVVGARTNIAPHDLPTISLAPQGAAESRIESAVPPMLSNQIGGSLPV